MDDVSVWWGRSFAPRTLILILMLNSFLQAALIWWPELFGPARDFLSGFTFAIALGCGIGALVSRTGS